VASSSMGGCCTDRAVLAANGSQPIALGHVRRISRTPMPVRTQRVLRNRVSGPGMAADHARLTGETNTAVEIAARAESGNGPARATLSRHADRLARGLAHVVNIIDPDVIVLGGDLSGLSHSTNVYRG
jgi:predicted NBD/HSP70 family sugar kinase